MNDADLYIKSNAMQRRDAKETIDEYSSKIKWREDGQDSLLDIGCGSGNVMMDYILPILPENFQRLVGADTSKEMVEYSSKHHVHPRVSFEYLELGDDITRQSLYEAEPFDHITSFYCLNWKQNQERAIKNFYKLLKPGGDMLLTLLAQNPIYDVYKQLSQNTKWAKYMTDVDHYISPYHFSKDAAGKLRKLLALSGFNENTVEIREKFHIFEGINTLNNAVKAVNPFINRVPEKDQNAFFDDFLDYVVKMGLHMDDINSNRQKCRFYVPYTLLIAYARKC